MPPEFCKLLNPLTMVVLQNALWRIVGATIPEPMTQELELTKEDALSFLRILDLVNAKNWHCDPEHLMSPEDTAEAMRVLGLIIKDLKEVPRGEIVRKRPKHKPKERRNVHPESSGDGTPSEEKLQPS